VLVGYADDDDDEEDDGCDVDDDNDEDDADDDDDDDGDGGTVCDVATVTGLTVAARRRSVRRCLLALSLMHFAVRCS
jgi:hypothetical protein